ncbi:class I SAM-dependent methyltransferase [Candidatus Microgenomates bacterium]|nr:class I SAM-dependent methyltransferase [Candidatus Microgenomates bacterium]
MKKHYNQEYFRERDHLDLLIAETIKKTLLENGLKKVLDVGCGSGRLVKFLNDCGFKTVGCDNQDQALRIAKLLNKKRAIIRASATKLPFRNGSFDFVSCISTIEHLTLADGKRFVKESYRVLKSGGLFFMITPNFASPMRYLLGKKWFGYSDPTHLYFYTPRSLSRLLEEFGFKNIKLQLKPAYNVPFDWYLPSFARKMPHFAKNFLTYLMIESPLSTFRDSFWIMGEKR